MQCIVFEVRLYCVNNNKLYLYIVRAFENILFYRNTIRFCKQHWRGSVLLGICPALQWAQLFENHELIICRSRLQQQINLHTFHSSVGNNWSCNHSVLLCIRSFPDIAPERIYSPRSLQIEWMCRGFLRSNWCKRRVCEKWISTLTLSVGMLRVIAIPAHTFAVHA